MPVSTSGVFDFIDRHPVCHVERLEVDLPEFRILRQNVRKMIVELHESGDPEALELSEGLRNLLLNWLTSPFEFDDLIAQQLLAVMGSAEELGLRWGLELQGFYAAAVAAARTLAAMVNPLRQALQEVLSQAAEDGEDFRIFCHKAAAHSFATLAPADRFLHSSANYRNAEPFDLLIKVGPLRSHGWGSTPDSIVSAPRFSRLVQIVWVGCADEEGFGYDPVVATQSIVQDGLCANAQVQELTILDTGSSVTHRFENYADTDEFQLLGTFADRLERRKATLVQIHGDNGLLYPPLAKVIGYDPSPDAIYVVAKRFVDEDLCEGMYLVRQALRDSCDHEVQAEHGHYSRIWKEMLADEIARDSMAFCRKLRSAGISLDGLHSAVKHWAKPPTTVIHAPQKKKHFEILVSELDIERKLGKELGKPSWGAWWKRAWSEIAASRGVAIQAGVQGHEEQDEELLKTLDAMLPEILEHALADGDSFFMVIPDHFELSGLLFFDRIISIEQGYKAPDNELRVIHEIGSFEQWRA